MKNQNNNRSNVSASAAASDAVKALTQAADPELNYRTSCASLRATPDQLHAYQLAIWLRALQLINNADPRSPALRVVLEGARAAVAMRDVPMKIAPSLLVEECIAAPDQLLAYRQTSAEVSLRGANELSRFRRMLRNRLVELLALGVGDMVRRQDCRVLLELVAEEIAEEGD